jgi:hypothetical protein
MILVAPRKAESLSRLRRENIIREGTPAIGLTHRYAISAANENAAVPPEP